MTEQNSGVSNELNPSPSRRGQKWTTAWVISVLVAGLFLAGWWFWNARSVEVHAAISDARSIANQTDVMTVEAISEGGASLAGRRISIVNARVVQVSGPRSFWVGGSEGEPLLVLMSGPEGDQAATPAPLEMAIGERVSINGVLRQGSDGDAPAAETRAHVSKVPVHLAASAVQKVDG